MPRAVLIWIALVGLAHAGGNPYSTPADLQRAIAAYDKACRTGDAASCVRLAKLQGSAGNAKAEAAATKRALAIYDAACAKKSAGDCEVACRLRTGSSCAVQDLPEPKIVKSKPVELVVYTARSQLPPALAAAVPADFDFNQHGLAMQKDLRIDPRYMDFVLQPPPRESIAGRAIFTVVISSMNVCSGGAYRPEGRMKREEPDDPSRPAPKIVKATHPLWIVPRGVRVWLEYWTTWHDCPPVP